MTEFRDLPDLACEAAGGAAIACNDEFFAEKENLLRAHAAEWREHAYTDRGKWMDGWESRRKREPGYDWCLIRLGLPGEIRGVDIDTNHFLGNYPEFASVDAVAIDGNPSAEELQRAEWTRIVPVSKLQGGSQHLFPVTSDKRWTHLRLNIYPDGGVARFRVHGLVRPDVAKLKAAGTVDLAAVENGGVSVLANDMFFSHRNNLIMPGRAANMGDGWETKRKRGPGNDWVVVRLGVPGNIDRVEVDTNHFKGNFPESCSLEGCYIPDEVPPDFFANRNLEWQELLPRTKLAADTRHYFEQELRARGPFTHVRLSIYPDGGVSRLRLHGRPEGQA